MAAFGVRIACYVNGVTIVNLCFNCHQSGSSNDNCQMRCVRRRAGHADKILVGVAEFTLPEDNEARSWTWVDEYIPESGEWDYVLQVKKVDGSGDFRQMLMTATHNKR